MNTSRGNNQDSAYVPLPKLFYSDLTGAPLEKCISCECKLLEGDVPYMVEKALKPYQGYRSYSTLFEYAMCMDCVHQMRSVISRESAEKITAYFSQNVDFGYRQKILQAAKGDVPLDYWVDRCMVKGTGIQHLSECQVYAQCIGDQLILGEAPYMVSGQALDEVVELLSPQTRDELDRFKDTVVDGPSEFQDLLQSGPKVFL